MNSDECLDGYRMIWRTMLWDGAPEALIDGLAQRKIGGMAALTPELIAELAAADAVGSIEDALELVRLGLEAKRQSAIAAAVRAAAGAAIPRILFKHEPNMVQVHVRQDLREAEWFGLTPHDAADMGGKLIHAARAAIAAGKR